MTKFLQKIYKIFNHQLSSYKWIKKLLIFSTITIMSVFSFNKIVDPYGIQNYFVDLKYKPVLNERAHKYKYIFYDNNIEKYDSLILGSSRVMKIEPMSSEFTKSFFNFGIHVANNSEKLFIIQEWLKRKKLKTVYLGVEYYNFHKNKKPLFVNYNDFQNSSSSSYLSVTSLKLSYKSLVNQFLNQPQTFFNEDGSINYYNNEIKISNNKYDFSQNKFATESKSYILDNMVNDPFIIDENVFDILNQINRLSKEHNFELIVFITPMQSEVHKILLQYKNLPFQFNYIRQRLVKEFGTIYDFGNLNSYNMQRENYYDPSHYRAKLGKKIILRLNNQISDYGEKLSSSHN